MNKEKSGKESRKCPWCGDITTPEIKSLKKPYGEVRERRCSGCGKLLAAYLSEEGDFLKKVRAFSN